MLFIDTREQSRVLLGGMGGTSNKYQENYRTERRNEGWKWGMGLLFLFCVCVSVWRRERRGVGHSMKGKESIIPSILFLHISHEKENRLMNV